MPRERPITSLDDLPVIIDPAMAARLLGKTADYIARLCKKGELPAHKVGREWRIFRDELIEYVKQC